MRRSFRRLILAAAGELSALKMEVVSFASARPAAAGKQSALKTAVVVFASARLCPADVGGMLPLSE